MRCWKKFNQKKWVLWQKHQGMFSSQLETVCVKFNRNSKHWEQTFQFTRICQEAAFIHEVAVGRFHRAASNVDHGFRDRTLVCREYTSSRADADSKIVAAIEQRTIIGPVLQVHTLKNLGKNGIEIQIPSTISSKKTSCVVICRGQNRNVE